MSQTPLDKLMNVDWRGLVKTATNKVKQYTLNLSPLEIAVEDATNMETWGPHGSAMNGARSQHNSVSVAVVDHGRCVGQPQCLALTSFCANCLLVCRHCRSVLRPRGVSPGDGGHSTSLTGKGPLLSSTSLPVCGGLHHSAHNKKSSSAGRTLAHVLQSALAFGIPGKTWPHESCGRCLEFNIRA